MGTGELISLCVSVATALFTFFFWIIQTNKERPRLKTYWGGDTVMQFEMPLGSSKGGYVVQPIRLDFCVANFSSLPNAVLGMRTWLKTPEGSWLACEVDPYIRDDDRRGVTALPVNVPPLQIVTLTRILHIELREPPNATEPYAAKDANLASPLQVKVELRSLTGKRFIDVVRRGEEETVKPAGQSKDHPGPDPGNLRPWEKEVDKELYFSIVGQTGGTLYGTDVYTSDSSVSTAAVHAGILKPGETGVIRVQIVAVPPAFEGTTRNGVTSGSWTKPWPGAYQVERP